MQSISVQETNQYVTFTLGDETYGFNVDCTREIAEYSSITPIPNTPEWVRGVINLRGSVIPVLDIKRKFGLAPTPHTSETRIIILELEASSERFVLGILADAVKNVLELPPSDIEPPPRFGGKISVSYIVGIGRTEEDFFVVLDVEKIFSNEELGAVTQVTEE